MKMFIENIAKNNNVSVILVQRHSIDTFAPVLSSSLINKFGPDSGGES